jgi:hypothetical protein
LTRWRTINFSRKTLHCRHVAIIDEMELSTTRLICPLMTWCSCEISQNSVSVFHVGVRNLTKRSDKRAGRVPRLRASKKELWSFRTPPLYNETPKVDAWKISIMKFLTFHIYFVKNRN